jgi:hypothetical protein
LTNVFLFLLDGKENFCGAALPAGSSRPRRVLVQGFLVSVDTRKPAAAVGVIDGWTFLTEKKKKIK